MALLRSPEAQIYSAHPVERLLRILEALSFWHASTYWHVKSLTILLPSNKFGRLVRRKAFLLCKNPCGAGCDGGRGSSSQRGKSPAQRNFQRKFALRRVGSCKFVVLPTTQYSKVREHARFVTLSVPGSSGCQRGRRPSVWEGVQRKPFQGFPLGNFFLTADAVLLCAAKKNSDSRWRLCRLTDMGCRAGVGTTRLAGFCQFSPDPWVTHSSKKPHTVGSGK